MIGEAISFVTGLPGAILGGLGGAVFGGFLAILLVPIVYPICWYFDKRREKKRGNRG